MITYTMTWANGRASRRGGGGSFVLTDKGIEHQFHYVSAQINDIQNPVFRAVAEEVSQSGALTGTVTVSIS